MSNANQGALGSTRDLGDVISDAEMARKFGELALAFTASQQREKEQLPLIVEDRGETWFVQGSWNRDRTIEGSGPFEMVIRKRNAEVLEFGVSTVIITSPEEDAYFKEILRQTGYHQTDEQKRIRAVEEAKWHIDVNEWFAGGVLGNVKTALRFGELVVARFIGQSGLNRQRPLAIDDHGDRWRIRGTNPDEDGLVILLTAGRRDAQVFDIRMLPATEASWVPEGTSESRARQVPIRDQLLEAMRGYRDKDQ